MILTNATDVSENDLARPLPIDISALRDDIIAYKNTMVDILDNQRDPRNIVGEEKYIDCLLAMENGRASENPNRSEFDAHNFEDTRDLVRYMHQTLQLSTDKTRPSKWYAHLPIAGGEHKVAVEIRMMDGKYNVVAYEAADVEYAEDLLKEISAHEADFPGVIHNMAVVVSNVQKGTFGCDSHGIVNILKNSQAPQGPDAIFSALAVKEKQRYKIYIDSYGNILDYSAYIHAQSETHTLGVVDNPRWYGLVDLEKDPLNKKKQPFAMHFYANRIIQRVQNIGEDESKLRVFSNSIDHKRLKALDRLIAFLEKLQKEHPEEAGTIFAEMLAKVWISRPPGWDRALPTVRNLVEPWDSTNNKIWERFHPLWGRPLNKLVPAFAEMLDAIPTWESSPTLRIQLLERISQKIAHIFANCTPDEIDASNARDLWKKIPGLIEALAPQVSDPQELHQLLKLNEQFVRFNPEGNYLAPFVALENCSTKLSDNSLQGMLSKMLVTIEDESKGLRRYQLEYGDTLLASIHNLIAAAPQEEKVSLLEPLLKTISNMTNEKVKTQLTSIVELAVNLNESEIRALTKAGRENTGPTIGGMSFANLTEVANNLRGRAENAPWLSFESMRAMVPQSDEITQDLGNSESAFETIDLDKHPMQRLARLWRERSQLLDYLPADRQEKWKSEQADLDETVKTWKEKLALVDAEKRRTFGLDDLEKQVAFYAEQKEMLEELKSAVAEQISVNLTEHKAYLDSMREKLLDIKKELDAEPNVFSPTSIPLRQGLLNLRLFEDVLTEARERLEEGSNSILSEMRLNAAVMKKDRQVLDGIFEQLARPPSLTLPEPQLIPPAGALEMIDRRAQAAVAQQLDLPESEILFKDLLSQWSSGPVIGKVVRSDSFYVYLQITAKNETPVIGKLTKEYAPEFANADPGQYFHVMFDSTNWPRGIPIEPPQDLHVEPRQESDEILESGVNLPDQAPTTLIVSTPDAAGLAGDIPDAQDKFSAPIILREDRDKLRRDSMDPIPTTEALPTEPQHFQTRQIVTDPAPTLNKRAVETPKVTTSIQPPPLAHVRSGNRDHLLPQIPKALAATPLQQYRPRAQTETSSSGIWGFLRGASRSISQYVTSTPTTSSPPPSVSQLSATLLAELERSDQIAIAEAVRQKHLQNEYKSDKSYLKLASDGMEITKGDVLWKAKNLKTNEDNYYVRVAAAGNSEQVLVVRSQQVEGFDLKVGEKFSGKLHSRGIGGRRVVEEARRDSQGFAR